MRGKTNEPDWMSWQMPTISNPHIDPSEINDTLMALLSMDMNELKEAFENPKATVLEKAVAGAIRKSIEKGSLYNIETIITRAMGKPKEQQDHTGEININVNYGHRHNASDTNAGSDLGII